eukprot:TRINITY_DN7243_c0_g1_i10.p2 TRINITY_DN7243_c0_g1~~TRINITY_DN7243_c0_g1_i10.p2  ORF type:complete len:133 (-),score=16.34 TRINITY_DN7243_c0_g1_i10:177-521(-)
MSSPEPCSLCRTGEEHRTGPRGGSKDIEPPTEEADITLSTAAAGGRVTDEDEADGLLCMAAMVVAAGAAGLFPRQAVKTPCREERLAGVACMQGRGGVGAAVPCLAVATIVGPL